jgi:HPt (histidine-containing phosphotransfer) domain-containing protein
MIDRVRFNENFQHFDSEIIVEIIDIFISEYDERFQNLRANVESRDFARLKFNAHSLKGVIANFMDPVTIEQSRTLDEMAKHQKAEGLDELYGELEKNSLLLLGQLKDIRKEII